jgi:hypothetical protein
LHFAPKLTDLKMPIEITRLAESDIPGAVTAIQEAFKDDPYNNWVYNDRAKVSRSHFMFAIDPQGCPGRLPAVVHTSNCSSSASIPYVII